MKYFNNCKTKEEAKKLWKELAKKLHPDKGGDNDEFIKMNAEYYTFCENFGKKNNSKKHFDIQGFEEFIKDNFGMDLEESMELAYQVVSNIANSLNRKNPVLGFLFNAVADRAYTKGKEIIENQKKSNSSQSSQTEVEDDDINIG